MSLGKNYNKRDGISFQCAECDFYGPKLKEHWTEFHSGVKLPFSCEICNLETYSEKHLEIHKRDNHESTFQCEECDFVTQKKRLFYQHKESHKIEEQPLKKRKRIDKRKGRPEKCPECDQKVFALAKHWEENHLDIVKPFLCHLCDHKTYTERYLQRHITKGVYSLLFLYELIDFELTPK